MTTRYATKQVTLDGRTFNSGDIIPEGLGDRAGAEKWSRLEGEAMPTPKVPEDGITSESISATADVQAEEGGEDTEDEVVVAEPGDEGDTDEEDTEKVDSEEEASDEVKDDEEASSEDEDEQPL